MLHNLLLLKRKVIAKDFIFKNIFSMLQTKCIETVMNVRELYVKNNAKHFQCVFTWNIFIQQIISLNILKLISVE